MRYTKRTNPQREKEIKSLLNKKYPNGVKDNKVYRDYANLAARVLKEGKVPSNSSTKGNYWELYHSYELDHPANNQVRDREDTDSYRLLEDGRLVCNSMRELTYYSNNYQVYDRGTKEYTPGEFDLIQIDLLLEENHIHGVLEAFLKDGGKNYHVAKDNPYVQKRIQAADEKRANENRAKRKAAAYKAKKTLGTVLVVVAWIIFGYFVYRFGKEFIFARDNLMYEASRYLWFGSAVIGLMSFAYALWSGYQKEMILFMIFCSAILCMIFAVAIYHFGSITQSYFWQQYLLLIIRFIIFIVIGQIVGLIIRKSK